VPKNFTVGTEGRNFNFQGRSKNFNGKSTISIFINLFWL